MLLCYSGLRLGDALKVGSKLKGDELLLYTAKTGTPVYVPLPSLVIAALMSFDPSSTQYFFWSGEGKLSTRIGNMWRALSRVFQRAGIKEGQAHRFRDTFSVGLLEKGVPLETVSVLLGHSSIRVTERHYAPWVQNRQEALRQAVRRAWALEASGKPAGTPIPEY